MYVCMFLCMCVCVCNCSICYMRTTLKTMIHETLIKTYTKASFQGMCRQTDQNLHKGLFQGMCRQTDQNLHKGLFSGNVSTNILQHAHAQSHTFIWWWRVGVAERHSNYQEFKELWPFMWYIRAMHRTECASRYADHCQSRAHASRQRHQGGQKGDPPEMPRFIASFIAS